MLESGILNVFDLKLLESMNSMVWENLDYSTPQTLGFESELYLY